MKSKLINDTIYKHIECSIIEDKILQTKIVNRLFFVTQNALAYFAYPSINTKRYIHSLGTMHMVAHMFKNSIINANENTKELFLKNLSKSIKSTIESNHINIKIKDIEKFEDKALFEFLAPIKSESLKVTFIITLQALRIVALLHDLGHLPFSHQVEYAMQKLYQKINNLENKTQKHKDFLEFYNSITNFDKLVLHEAIGFKFIKLLFEHELNVKNDPYMRLLFELTKNIINEKKDKYFDYKVLHSFVDSTVDADRLDYINRDMLSSGYISGEVDFIRITKQSVLVHEKDKFVLSFFDEETIDIEHMLEMRFNLYKKIIYNHKIAATDTHLENVILFLAQNFFDEQNGIHKYNVTDCISMLWKFLDNKDLEMRLDVISQLDENWLITLFKKEYFLIKNKKIKNINDKKYLKSFEEVLFAKRFFNAIWKNLNDLYTILGFTEVQRYKFRESFGYVSDKKYKLLQKNLDQFCLKYEDENRFLTFQIVSLNIGIDKNFCLYDGNKLIKIDEVSTIRKRLKKSILNTVPFYLYSNNEKLSEQMKNDLKDILINTFL